MDEDVAGDLHAEGHEGVVVTTGVVPASLVRACFKFTAWCGTASSGADSGVKDETGSLPCLETLFGEIDPCAFTGTGDLEGADAEGKLEGIAILSGS